MALIHRCGDAFRTRAPHFLHRSGSISGILVILLCACTTLDAQSISLLPSIGLDAPPLDSDSICGIPLVAGHSRGYRDAGLAVGTVCNDFTLYDVDGRHFTLSEALKERKPVLLVNSSYTCPVFREKIPLINEIAHDRGDALIVAIIYTLEAHPLKDTSVYYGYVNTTEPNFSQGVLYRQPRTYGERRQVAAEMLAELSIDVPVYIDGPCNEWWSHYGPAPNNAYLIDTNGVIVAKHGWFDRHPDYIEADIARLFGESVGQEDSTVGSFIMGLLTPTIVSGTMGDVLSASTELRNNSDGRVEIEIARRIDQMPDGWATALCTDICLDVSEDSTLVVLDPGEAQVFTFYFYTGPSPGTARATVSFRNAGSPQNRFQQTFTAITEPTTSIITSDSMHASERAGFDLYPNPGADVVSAVITLDRPAHVSLDLFGPLGRHFGSPYAGVLLTGGTHDLALPDLPAGIYFVRLRSDEGEWYRTLRIVR